MSDSLRFYEQTKTKMRQLKRAAAAVAVKQDENESKDATEDVFMESKKSSLIFLSLNDYLRRLLQKKRRAIIKKPTSENGSMRRTTTRRRRMLPLPNQMMPQTTTDIDVLVTRNKCENKTIKQRRRSLKRADGFVCGGGGAGNLSKNKLNIKKFCDFNFNETNNYTSDTNHFSSKFNQLGQLKIWYV
jgi:uncharacterized FAD-dependent dehydrogenase